MVSPDKIWYNFTDMSKEFSNKYAIVDLEATSASATAEIIQIGIVILENDQIIETYQTDVNPHEKLSEHIIQLTGITDEQLAKAPDFIEVAGRVYNLLKDCIFVAHNVKFDANLLAEHLFFEGYELRTPRVDTVELSQVLYPTLEKYNLSYISEVLEIDLDHAHTAISDAMATANLFLKLKEKLASLPKETLELLLTLSDSLLFESYLVLEEVFKNMQTIHHNKSYQSVGNLLLRKNISLPKEKKLSQDFTVNMALLGLEARDEQKEFADIMVSRLANKDASFIQAETGIGKTYAYLLSLLANQSGQIIISVPTKILQDQIVANELKKIQDVFHISYQSLKGPANYIQLDRFYQTLQEEGNRSVNRYKMQVIVWLLETSTGDLDEIGQRQRLDHYFDDIKHTGYVPSHSLFYEVDFWRRHEEEAKTSRVIVTNHAYFLERVQDDKAFAKGKCIVFDEAQKLVFAIEEFSRQEIDITQILLDIKKELKVQSSLLVKRLLEGLFFELSQLSISFYQFHQKDVSEEVMTKISRLAQELCYLGFYTFNDLCLKSDKTFWLESETSLQKRSLYLKSTQNNLMSFAEFLPETQKNYFISATLTISPQVSLPDLLGMKTVSFDSLEYSPKKNQALWIDSSMPLLGTVSDTDYAREIVLRLQQVLTLERPLFVLFTSRKMLVSVSDLLDECHIDHLAQEKNGTAFSLKKRFDIGESSILLGMGTFWEGVDFSNQDRLIEVVTRLPFHNPKDQFTQKMHKNLQDRGQDPFYMYHLPMMMLKLRQAFGRVNRHEKQTSALLILDNRLIRKQYGSIVLEDLGRLFPIHYGKISDYLSEMRKFLL